MCLEYFGLIPKWCSNLVRNSDTGPVRSGTDLDTGPVRSGTDSDTGAVWFGIDSDEGRCPFFRPFVSIHIYCERCK